MNRRDFLKIVGITTATSTAALYGCGSKFHPQIEMFAHFKTKSSFHKTKRII